MHVNSKHAVPVSGACAKQGLVTETNYWNMEELYAPSPRSTHVQTQVATCRGLAHVSYSLILLE